MRCLVCESEKETEKIDNIYTIGSEGTDLCLDCRIKVSNYIRGLINLAGSVRHDTIKKYRKQG